MLSTSPSLAGALGHDLSDRRISILRHIGALGSISKAARAVGVSYKAAWQAVDTLTNLAGVPLVERVVGGVGGGGAQLTAAGAALLEAADVLTRSRSAVLAQMQSEQLPLPRLGLRTSMRNQWPCVVLEVEPLGPLTRVHLQGAGEAGEALRVVARITRESAQLMGIEAGQALLVLCKATAVRVLPVQEPSPSGNVWAGRVVRLSRGPQGDEVAAQLDAGVQMVGFAPAGCRLRTRGRVWMCADESAMVLAHWED